MKICTIDKCGKPARTQSSDYCKMHYHRIYRNGTLGSYPKRKTSYVHSQGYIIEYAKNHPLSVKNYVYQHRRVYYDNYGNGPFKCAWCEGDLYWDNLHIDHLDDNKKNNHISNLVASCPSCNQNRGKFKRRHLWKHPRWITFRDETKCLSDWALELGISHAALATRLAKWDFERALTESKGNRGPRRKSW